MLGCQTNKHWRSNLGIMQEKSLNDILEGEPAIEQCLGSDILQYLRALLSDPRGFNLRNRLAHGLVAPQEFSQVLSARVLHVLFVLSLLRQHDDTGEEEAGKSDPGVGK